MATNAGYSTVVSISSDDVTYNALTLCDDAPVDAARDMITITQYGDTAPAKLAGLKKFSGSLSFFWDYADSVQTTVRNAVANGTTLYLKVLPDGTHGFKCAIKCSKIGVKPQLDGAPKCDVSFEETGAFSIV